VGRPHALENAAVESVRRASGISAYDVAMPVWCPVPNERVGRGNDHRTSTPERIERPGLPIIQFPRGRKSRHTDAGAGRHWKNRPPERWRGLVAEWLELATHNRLVGGSSPPGPTTHSDFRRDFPAVWYLAPNWPSCGVSFVSAAVSVNLSGMFRSSLSLRAKFRFPEAEIPVRRDTVRMQVSSG
jgi:hypothetical protein